MNNWRLPERLAWSAIVVTALFSASGADAQREPDQVQLIRLVARTFEARGLEDGLADGPDERIHVIAQFSSPLSPRQLLVLERRGIRLLDSIPDNAYFAVLSRSILSRDLIGPGFFGGDEDQAIVAIVGIRPTDKVAPRLLNRNIDAFPQYGFVPGTTLIRVTVQFHGDTADERAHRDVLEALRRGGAGRPGIELREEGALPLANGMQLAVPLDRLLDLASHDSIKWIELVAPPAEDDNDIVRGVSGVNADAVNPPSLYDVTGEGVVIAQWESGVADHSHADFGTPSRITHVDATPVLPHATHVAGTAIGSGAASDQNGNGGSADQWRGLAPGATLRSYNSIHFIAEYADAKDHNATISTNSWGRGHCHTDNLQDPPIDNCYDSNTGSYDEVVSGKMTSGAPSTGVARRMLIVGSAGNVGIPERFADTNANNSYDPGEPIFTDADDSGTANVPTMPLPRFDTDWFQSGLPSGTPLVNFKQDIRHDDKGAFAGEFDYRPFGGGVAFPSDNVYRDVDDSETVTAGDVRLTTSAFGAAGSTVLGTDMDVNNVEPPTYLRPFNLWGNTRRPNSAKNTIVVGAYNSTGGLLWRNSSRGPTPDGRVKPDIVGPGSENNDFDSIESTVPVNAYTGFSSTSMATPTVSGTAALLTEWYRRACEPGDPKPSTLRAMLLHSAVDVKQIPHVTGSFVGPDYAYGYGRVNAPAALGLIPHHVEGAIDFDAMGSPTTATYRIVVGAVQDLKVTLAWDDPPWSNSAAIDPVTGLLQTDLDLEVEAPNGIVYTPWQLDPSNPFQPAVQSLGYPSGAVPASARDRRNTIEQIVVPNAQAGTWTIRVIGFKLLPTIAPQDYSLVSELIGPSTDPAQNPCSGLPTPDVWLRDNVDDDGSTPSSGQMWLSPDVWNRADPDDYADAHQNPVYGQRNGLFVRLRNGSAELARATSVEIWIAPASTGLSWPANFAYVGRLAAPNIAAGDIRIVGPLLWDPPSPTPSNHYCLYIRVLNPQDPIAIVEGGDVGDNARGSNNIAWRNLNVVDVQAATSITFLTQNPLPETAAYEIVMNVPTALLRTAKMTVTLAPELQLQWLESSARAVGFSVDPELALARERPLTSLPPRQVMTAMVEPSASGRTGVEQLRLGPINYRGFQAAAVRLTFTSSAPRQRAVHTVDVIQQAEDGDAVGGIRYLVRTGRASESR